MPSYTQEELLKIDFKDVDKGILGGLLRSGLYIMGATSKIGKTMIATSIANAVANGDDYLGKSNRKSKVIYFDNDNYDYEAKNRVLALKLKATPNIRYVFGEEATSIRNIKEELKYEVDDLENYSLVIVDSFIGLDEFINSDNCYQSLYPIIKDFRDFIVERSLVCIVLHHTKKGETTGKQDKLIGPKAMSGATTGTIIINVVSEFSKTGTLEFMLRHKKEIIPIKKDGDDIGWVLREEDDEGTEEIPRNILNLINTLVSKENKQIKGTSQEIVCETKMEVNPYSLFKYLNKHEEILKQNLITFEKGKSGKRFIIIRYEGETE